MSRTRKRRFENLGNSGIEKTIGLADKGNAMNVFSIRMIRGIGVLVAIWLSVTGATAQTATSRIVKAANGFLATLNEKQRQSVLFAFDDEQQRARWSNFPTGFVPRGGISLKEMNSTQRAAAMALVSSALSRKGFEKVEQIMEGDEVNKISEANRPSFDNNGGRPPRANGNGPPPTGAGPPPGSGNGPPPGNGTNRPPFGGG